MSATQTIDTTDIICGLKAAVTELECRHNAQLLKEQKAKAQCKIISPSVYITIPIHETVSPKKKKVKSKPTSLADAPSKSIAEPSKKDKKSKDKKKCVQRDETSVIFPEMRGSILYTKCYCLHRDGLQDFCPLSQCQGQPECLIKPWAMCPPGKFIRSRYPELYPETSKTDCVTIK